MGRTGYVTSGGCTVHRLAKRFRSSFWPKVGERGREREGGERKSKKRPQGFSLKKWVGPGKGPGIGWSRVYLTP